MSHLSIRLTPEEKTRWSELARRFGYPTMSEFIRETLTALDEKCGGGEEWESSLVHLDGDRVTGQVIESAEPSTVCAFPVAAPARFWRYLEEIREGSSSDSTERDG